MKMLRSFWVLIALVLIMAACQSVTGNTPDATESTTPEWFGMELIDAQTGETFTINDYAGKVILLETMAMWCPNCVVQANEVRDLYKTLGNPEDLIMVSLDVDINEDTKSLGEYASGYKFEWHFAVAPLEVARALGNLYTAQYLNPPLSPMMIIDREGNVHHLEYGFKDAETLQKVVEPYLVK